MPRAAGSGWGRCEEREGTLRGFTGWRRQRRLAPYSEAGGEERLFLHTQRALCPPVRSPGGLGWANGQSDRALTLGPPPFQRPSSQKRQASDQALFAPLQPREVDPAPYAIPALVERVPDNTVQATSQDGGIEDTYPPSTEIMDAQTHGIAGIPGNIKRDVR